MSRPGMLALLIAVAAMAATSASAADLPAPSGPVYKAPAPYAPAVYNWTGFYVGGLIGVNYNDATFQNTTSTGFEPAGTNTTLGYAGLLGGAQVGADYEFNQIVIGVAGSWLASSLITSSIAPSPLAGLQQRATVEGRYYATATARIGYAMDALLLYAKGGAAWGRETYGIDVLNGGTVASTQLLGAWRSGFTVGGGIEYEFTERISGVIEYDFLDFGNASYYFGSVTYPTSAAGGTGTGLPVSVTEYVHEIMVGLNLRFN